MKQTLLKAAVIFFGILLWGFIIKHNTIKSDDPPKEKKSKKDTVQIDIEQMQQKNLDLDQHNKMLDSLLMKIDTLKKKK